MWEVYRDIIRRYPGPPLSEERRLIAKAQKGSRLRQGFGGQARKSKDEIIFRHIGFLIFRIHKVAFPGLVHRFGEDLLEEAIVVAYNKIKSYDLDYRDKEGNLNPVKFVSYIWKRIDGFIIDYLKKEINEPN